MEVILLFSTIHKIEFQNFVYFQGCLVLTELANKPVIFNFCTFYSILSYLYTGFYDDNLT